MLDVQYHCQHHFFGRMARAYFDNQKRDDLENRQRASKYDQCYEQLPETFTVQDHAVSGVKDSNHLTGCAADIRCRDGEQAMRYATLLIDLFREAGRQWDEIIVEKKRSTRFWVHFAVKPETNRYTPNRCKVTVIELK